MSLQGSQMETDDPTTSYMLQVWVHFLIPQTQNLSQHCHHYILGIIVGMGQALQVLGTGFPALHECSHASFTSVCSIKA